MLTTAQRNEFLALILNDFSLAEDWENLKNYAKDTKAHWSVCLEKEQIVLAQVHPNCSARPNCWRMR